ncbi:MAG: hypothetical protein IPO78_00635 [Saprospiraceae bacterium]|nr:hypothetical protein [Saprospiraceae bacterium]
MKNFISNLLPGIAGGALVLGSFLWYHSNTTHSISDRSYTHQVNEAIPVTVGPDFSIAAEKALNVVVQINAQESEKLARQKWRKTTLLEIILFLGNLNFEVLDF